MPLEVAGQVDVVLDRLGGLLVPLQTHKSHRRVGQQGEGTFEHPEAGPEDRYQTDGTGELLSLRTTAGGSAPASIPRPALRAGTRQTGPAIASTSVSASGVLTRTVLVGIEWVASATTMRASSFIACLNSGVRVSSSRKTLSFWRTSGPSTTCRFFASSIKREGLRQGGDPGAQIVRLTAHGPDDYLGDLAHLLLAHSARGHRRRPKPDAAGYGRGLGVVGNHVLVTRHAYAV